MIPDLTNATPATREWYALSEDIRTAAVELAGPLRPMTHIETLLAIGRAIAGERERDRWQPIETAPRDGTRILLRLSNGEVFSGWGTEEAGFQKFHADGTDIGWLNPRHWQPLPSPPSGGDE